MPNITVGVVFHAYVPTYINCLREIVCLQVRQVKRYFRALFQAAVQGRCADAGCRGDFVD